MVHGGGGGGVSIVTSGGGGASGGGAGASASGVVTVDLGPSLKPSLKPSHWRHDSTPRTWAILHGVYSRDAYNDRFTQIYIKVRKRWPNREQGIGFNYEDI